MSYFSYFPRIQARDTITGEPAQGYKLNFYTTGSSTTRKDTFQEEAKSTTNANPVVSGSDGWFDPIVLDSGSYNVVFTDADDNVIWSLDPVTDFATAVNALISASSSSANVNVLNNSWTYAVSTGSADAIVLTLTPVPSSYVDGMTVLTRGFSGSNTITNPTINVNTKGTKTIKKGNAEPLAIGDIGGTDHTLRLTYNSNDDCFILENPRNVSGFFTAGGTVNALTLTDTNAPLVNGATYYVTPTGANTGATTLDFNGNGAVEILDMNGGPIGPGNISGTGHLLELVYKSSDTSWRLKNPAFVPDFIRDLVMSSDTDTAHDINITAGSCKADNSEAFIALSSEITKQIDAAWAEGDDAGGRPSGVALSNWTLYYFFVIAKTDGTTDAGWDTSATAANLLSDATGYTLYRCLGACWTDGSANIVYFHNKQYVGLNRESLDITSSYNSGTGMQIPTYLTHLARVIVVGAGGGASFTGAGSDGGDTTFQSIVAGGGEGASTIAGGVGGVPSGITSSDWPDIVRAAVGQSGRSADGGGESGIVSIGGENGGGNYYGGLLTGGADENGTPIRGGGGGGNGGSGADTGGGGAAVILERRAVSGTITVDIGAGGSGGTGSTSNYDGADGYIIMGF